MSDKPRLWIAPHVRACRCDNLVILLDLQRNRYLSIGGTAASVLDGAVGGWPGNACPSAPAPTQADLTALTAPLARQGLLVHTSAPPIHVDRLPTPNASWPQGHVSESGRIRAKSLFRLLRHAAAASGALRRHSFAEIVDHMNALRQRYALRPQSAPMTAWRDTVSAFVHLRPYLLSTNDRCLHDSLTLARLLLAEDTLARWVIGVQASPFAAHAWVQRGSVVLGDDHERIRRFVPILVA